MRATYAKIYRDLEQFLDWAGTVIDRAPKLPTVQILCADAVHDISDALSITALALLQDKGRERLELIKALQVRLQHIDSIFGYFYVISGNRKDPETGELIKPRARILTKKQKATFTTKMHNLWTQADAWYNANSVESAESVSTPDLLR